MIAQDARRGRVYCQCFDAELNPLDDLVDEAPDSVAELLQQGSWRLGGSGAQAVRASLDDGVDVTLIDGSELDARAVALAADRRLAKGERPVRGFDLTPLYIRPPDAVRPKPLVSALKPAALDRA